MKIGVADPKAPVNGVTKRRRLISARLAALDVNNDGIVDQAECALAVHLYSIYQLLFVAVQEHYCRSCAEQWVVNSLLILNSKPDLIINTGISFLCDSNHVSRYIEPNEFEAFLD